MSDSPDNQQRPTRRVVADVAGEVHVALRTACARRRITTSELVEEALRALLVEAGELASSEAR